MSELLFGVPGPVVAWCDSAEVRLPAGKRRPVLAMLLLNAEDRVDRERIVEILWPGGRPSSAVNRVQKYVGELRRMLGLDRPILAPVAGGYLLRLTDAELDSRGFVRQLSAATAMRSAGDLTGARRRVTDALRLWRGPAFAGLETPGAVAERARLDEYSPRTVEELAELDLTQRDNARAIADYAPFTTRGPR